MLPYNIQHKTLLLFSMLHKSTSHSQNKIHIKKESYRSDNCYWNYSIIFHVGIFLNIYIPKKKQQLFIQFFFYYLTFLFLLDLLFLLLALMVLRHWKNHFFFIRIHIFGVMFLFRIYVVCIFCMVRNNAIKRLFINIRFTFI